MFIFPLHHVLWPVSDECFSEGTMSHSITRALTLGEGLLAAPLSATLLGSKQGIRDGSSLFSSF